jgi:hypothetical protein
LIKEQNFRGDVCPYIFIDFRIIILKRGYISILGDQYQRLYHLKLLIASGCVAPWMVKVLINSSCRNVGKRDMEGAFTGRRKIWMYKREKLDLIDRSRIVSCRLR